MKIREILRALKIVPATFMSQELCNIVVYIIHMCTCCVHVQRYGYTDTHTNMQQLRWENGTMARGRGRILTFFFREVEAGFSRLKNQGYRGRIYSIGVVVYDC